MDEPISATAAEVFLRALEVDKKVGLDEFNSIPTAYLSQLFASELEEFASFQSLLITPFTRLLQCFNADVDELFGGNRSIVLLWADMSSIFPRYLLSKPSSSIIKQFLAGESEYNTEMTEKDGSLGTHSRQEKAVSKALELIGPYNSLEREAFKSTFPNTEGARLLRQKLETYGGILNNLLYPDAEVKQLENRFKPDSMNAHWRWRAEKFLKFKADCDFLT